MRYIERRSKASIIKNAYCDRDLEEMYTIAHRKGKVVVVVVVVVGFDAAAEDWPMEEGWSRV